MFQSYNIQPVPDVAEISPGMKMEMKMTPFTDVILEWISSVISGDLRRLRQTVPPEVFVRRDGPGLVRDLGTNQPGWALFLYSIDSGRTARIIDGRRTIAARICDPLMYRYRQLAGIQLKGRRKMEWKSYIFC